MRKTLSIVLTLVACFSGQRALAQQSNEVPHLLRIRVRSEAIAPLRAAFAAHRASERDIQRIVLGESDTIGALLALPPYFQITQFAPFAAEHNAVFEDVRERLNPGLFGQRDLSYRTNTTDNALRASEEKLSRWFILEYAGEMSPDRAVFLASYSPVIELAEPVYARQFQSQPNDSLLGSQYYLALTHTLQAWDVQRCDSTMLVASIDEGIYLAHPDLVDAIWHNPGEMGLNGQGNPKQSDTLDNDNDGYIDDWQGWDFAGYFGITSSNSPSSVVVHGCHTAGILAATGNNRIGIAGVAFGAKVLIVKVADSFGDAIIQGYHGIIYAVDRGAKVISCSWGGPGRAQSEQDVIDYADAKGSIVVCSAGNNGASPDENYPSAYEHTVSVAWITASLSPKDASQPSRHVSIGAPGDSILSTYYSIGKQSAGDTTDQGTSMAAPQAAGALALIRQHWPNATNRWAMERLRATCDTLTSDSKPGFNGRGIINVYRALTDVHAYSLRLDSAVILSDSGNDWLESGQTAHVKLVFKNYLDSLPDARVSIELLAADGTPLPPGGHFSVNPIQIGPISPIGPMQTSTATISVTADSTTPPETDLLVRLWLSDPAVGYKGDYDYFVVHANPGYLTLHNNLAVTITDNGAIGYRDATLDEQGAGFEWVNAPGGLRPDARGVLLGGGLIVAKDSTHVVDALGDFNFGGSIGKFKPRAPLLRQEITRYGPGDYITGAFSDSLYDTSQRIGLRMLEQCSALPAPANHAVVVTYAFFPSNYPSTVYQFDAGLYMDWDIGDYGLRDSAWFDLADSIFFVERSEPGYAVIAMKLTDVFPATSPLKYYALNNTNNDGGFSVGGLFPASLKWSLFQQNKANAGKGDVAVLLGANMNFLHMQASLTYIMALGVSVADARKNVMTTLGVMNGTLGVSAVPASGSGIDFWPNPATQRIRILAHELPSGAALTIGVSDMLGRSVLRATVRNGDEIDLSLLSAGMYAVEVSGQGTHSVRTVVKQ